MVLTCCNDAFAGVVVRLTRRQIMPVYQQCIPDADTAANASAPMARHGEPCGTSDPHIWTTRI